MVTLRVPSRETAGEVMTFEASASYPPGPVIFSACPSWIAHTWVALSPCASARYSVPSGDQAPRPKADMPGNRVHRTLAFAWPGAAESTRPWSVLTYAISPVFGFQAPQQAEGICRTDCPVHTSRMRRLGSLISK